ncbi:hypothetical protein HCA61_07365 [Rhodococcus sp. HNM0563]|uniref:hypothetical protein n=1 Tax=Rhodococcus sp. HNM0563 TaxID=2716339 RepID=UPI00146C5E6A|nr:hypothetical protein [Rhodococcus sp. HNM0563]NLU62082.1 hypothetical protein [Rhodococcus sp. HNM0563]
MIPLTRLIDLIVRGTRSLGGHNGRIMQSLAWVFVIVVLGAGIGIVAIGVAHIDDLVNVLVANSEETATGEVR